MSSKEFHLEFSIDPNEYRRIAEGQRELLCAIADRLAQGLPLDDLSLASRHIAAAALRLAAVGIPDEPPRRPGRQPKICASSVALEYVAMVRNPVHEISRNKAKELLAEKYGVTVEAIRKALGKNEGDAEALFDWAAQHGQVHFANQQK